MDGSSNEGQQGEESMQTELARISNESAQIPTIQFDEQLEPMTEDQDFSRSVFRHLRGLPLFMISLNATLGVGLYWRSGTILEVAGPLGIVLSFLILGGISSAVMQCTTEMLSIWPVPNATSTYVSFFVDKDLGIAVGITYWFTYSISFAALLATVAAEVDYWGGSPALKGTVIFVVVPAIMVLVNSVRVEIYGFIEVVLGVVKIIFFVIIFLGLIAISAGVGKQHNHGGEFWQQPAVIDRAAATNWGPAFLMSLSIAAFAFIGVESFIASSVEARWPDRRQNERPETERRAMTSNQTVLVGNAVRKSAIWMPLIAATAYFVIGLLVSLNIAHADCSLPRLNWVRRPSRCPVDSKTLSPIVAIMEIAGMPGFASASNFFLVFAATSCANTNLYIASRTLFGLTRQIIDTDGASWYVKIVAWFGHTNSHRVPVRAMAFSALAFIWVPFLQLVPDASKGSSASASIMEVLAQMGSVGVILVWTCQCIAYLRFYNCLNYKGVRAELNRVRKPQLRRWNHDSDDDYPWRSHGQPLTMYLALSGCLFVLIIANGAFLFKGFLVVPFIYAYVTLFIFAIGIVVSKLISGRSWRLVDLSDPNQVIRIIDELNQIRIRSSDSKDPQASLWNFWRSKPPT